MPNEFVKVFEKIGHGIEVVFEDGKTVATKLPQYIEATQDGFKDSPTIVADVTEVVTSLSGGAALFDALVAAVSGFGTNAAADMAAVTALAENAPKLGSYWTNVKTSVGKLLTDLGADEKQIAAIFTPPAPSDAAAA